AQRPAHRAGNEVRTGYQPQNCENARPDDPTVAAGAGRPGDRVGPGGVSLVTGSCGGGRGCISEWAATSVSRQSSSAPRKRNCGGNARPSRLRSANLLPMPDLLATLFIVAVIFFTTGCVTEGKVETDNGRSLTPEQRAEADALEAAIEKIRAKWPGQ